MATYRSSQSLRAAGAAGAAAGPAPAGPADTDPIVRWRQAVDGVAAADSSRPDAPALRPSQSLVEMRARLLGSGAVAPGPGLGPAAAPEPSEEPPEPAPEATRTGPVRAPGSQEGGVGAGAVVGAPGSYGAG